MILSLMRDNLIRARWALGLAVALALTSMLLYPGGTALVRSTVHYSPQHNFLSDLGMTVAYNGQPNLPGAVLFVASLLLLLGGALALLTELVKVCAMATRSRKLARSAAVVALGACLAFVGVAFTPENRLMAAHLNFTCWGFRIAPVATLLFTLAVVSSTSVPRSVTGLLALLTSALAVYVTIFEWGPDVASSSGLHVQVLAQKAIAGIAVFTLLALSVAIPRAASNAAQVRIPV